MKVVQVACQSGLTTVPTNPALRPMQPPTAPTAFQVSPRADLHDIGESVLFAEDQSQVAPEILTGTVLVALAFWRGVRG